MHVTKDSETDAEVIKRIREGKIDLFEVLMRRSNPFLYKVGMSYGYKHEDVEDLMQETYIAAYVNLEKFESRSSFKTWITRIMLNQCYHKAQKLSFKNEKPNDNIIIDEKTNPMFESDKLTDGYKTVLNRELGSIVANALLAIPFDYRIVFSLRELSGISTAETADILQISETNVKVRLNRAKNMLREKMKETYDKEEIFEFNRGYCDEIVSRVMAIIKGRDGTV